MTGAEGLDAWDDEATALGAAGRAGATALAFALAGRPPPAGRLRYLRTVGVNGAEKLDLSAHGLFVVNFSGKLEPTRRLVPGRSRKTVPTPFSLWP